MKNFILGSLLLFLMSCGQESTIKPLFDPRSVSQQQGREDGLSVFKAKYKFSSDVDSPTDVSLKVPVLGPVFRELTNSIGNLVLSTQSNREVELDDLPIEIPDIDYDLVREVKIKRIFFTIDKAYLEDGSFKFIENIGIFIPNDEDTKLQSREELTKTGAVQIAEYDMKDRVYNCQSNKCMDFRIYDVNLTEVMKGKKVLHVKPFMSITKVPKKKFKFSGYIEVEMKLFLPF